MPKNRAWMMSLILIVLIKMSIFLNGKSSIFSSQFFSLYKYIGRDKSEDEDQPASKEYKKQEGFCTVSVPV